MSHALVYGAGASLAAPARRPLFDGVRRALTDRVGADLGPAIDRMAPEALLSRLVAAGVDVDDQLRRMLSGGEPNALHFTAAELRRRGGAVWTTNFDELIEAAAAARGIDAHRLLPGDDPQCACGRGHLVKIHGTLGGARVLARSEEVPRPLPDPWLARLRGDLRDARVAIVGYAGADIDLRFGLVAALAGAEDGRWFARDGDAEPLARRFEEPIAAGRLTLELSERPDLAAFAWARAEGLAAGVDADLADQLALPIERRPISASYETDRLLVARVLDDFGRAHEARRGYRAALLRGPRRRRAGSALYSSGMIHGAPWRPPVVALLSAAAALPARWRWPHRQRLPYLTWNVEAEPRLRALERSLHKVGDDPAVVQAAANAAKEVDPARAIALARGLQRQALEAERPAQLAWATFTLSLALRWLGDVAAAREQANRLADAYGPLAGPSWTAWGHFESGAVCALAGELDEAVAQMHLAIEVFAAAGSMFEFDGWCGAIAIERARGDDAARAGAYAQAVELLRAAALRRRFMAEVLSVEEAETARAEGRLDEAAALYERLARSRTLAQRVLGLLGAGEVQRRRGREPFAAWQALRVSEARGFGFGAVHACVTLGLAGAMEHDEAERRIAASVFAAPVRADASGLLRYCQGPDAEAHTLCFP